MLKVLIVDDEPLVQIGLKSMINWNALGYEICGTASNGDAAYHLIEDHMPEIVIADVQMPCLSGLELAKKCRETFGRIPVFIMLSGYEDFHYAKEALSFQAIDYLIKIDLTPEILTDALNAASAEVDSALSQTAAPDAESLNTMLFSQRFYIQLLNNLFENETQYETQAHSLSIHLDYPLYCAAQIEMKTDQSKGTSALYSSTLHMFEELIEKYVSCRVIPLDSRFFAVLFYSNGTDASAFRKETASALARSCGMIFHYYSVHLYAAVGRIVTNIMEISSSYYDARQISSYVCDDPNILFFDDMPNTNKLQNVFNLSIFRKDITRAFEELDEDALRKTMDGIIDLLSQEHVNLTQAMDVSGSILYFTLTLLSNGGEAADRIFHTHPDSYRSLYRQKSVASIIVWLKTLEEGLCKEFQAHPVRQKNFLVENTKKYIDEHLNERISLTDLAECFHVSPNYLSQLFKKYMDIGINKYICQKKIDASKELLKQPELKIYEVADHFGFENAFYYNKVFKRVTGISPKEFRSHLHHTDS